MTQPRGRHTATRLGDGRVLIAGGWNEKALGSAEVFDPGTGAFVPVSGSMVKPR